ncbi:glycosyltransferase family 2 protein [Raoultella sp. C349492]|uniref:glycosyltransferase family 2 protein n=1 Tax=Raoultella sp. C349492 TaxID=2970253 RepID=UPI0035C73DD9
MDISVIIPCFNREDSIRGAVLSVLNQLGSHNIEVIVVDDGSTDSSIDKIDDLDVKILRTNGRTGACNARNLGISEANNKWVAFNDSDDYWRIDKLDCIEKKLALSNDVDYIFHPFIRTIGLKTKLGGIYQNNIGIVNENDFLKTILTKNMISTQCLIAKKNILIESGMFDVELKRFQDWDLALRICAGNTGLYVPELLCICIESVDSISKGFKKGISAREYLFKKYYHLYSKNKIAMLKFKLSLQLRKVISLLKRG